MIFVGFLGLLVVATLMFLALRTASRQSLDPARERSNPPERPANRPRATSRALPSSRLRSPPPTETGDAFRFYPELFEHRTHVIEKLETKGFSWFTHYSAVDCLHDVHGLEVCGIHERDDALRIRSVLADMFPDWKPG